MDDLVTILIRLAIVGTMVIGGSLFAFSTFIMAALKRLSDAEGIRAMQQINKTVFTPWFMVPFFGTALLSLCAVAFALDEYGSDVVAPTAWCGAPVCGRLVPCDRRRERPVE